MNDPHSTPAEAMPERDAGNRAGEGALVLYTTLLGPLVIPDGAGLAVELADLAERPICRAAEQISTIGSDLLVTKAGYAAVVMLPAAPVPVPWLSARPRRR